MDNVIFKEGGGDHKALFAAYYTANGTDQAKSGKSFVHEIPLVKKLLNILQKQHKNADDFHKRQWLSIPLQAGFSRQMLVKAGWKISSSYKSWNTAKQHCVENHAGSPVVENRGRKGISKKIKSNIKKFVSLENCSYLGSKLVYNGPKLIDGIFNEKRKKINVRYRYFSMSKLYGMWKKNCKENAKDYCPMTQFRKIIADLKFLKKPKTKTDMCSICVEGEKLSAKLEKEKDKKKRKVLEKRIKLYNRHREDELHQRLKFKESISKIEKNHVVLVLDFKQNIKINTSPNTQISSEFYTPPQRTVFEAVAFYTKNDVVVKRYYDFISDNLQHNSFFVIKALQKLFRHKKFSQHKFSVELLDGQ